MLDRLFKKTQAEEPKPEVQKITNDEERNRFIAARLSEGMSLSDLQKLLAEQHGINMTYLDLRLIASDLKVDWAKADKKQAAKQKKEPTPDLAKMAAAGKKGSTQITVHKVVRPGASMSGEVQFASGAKGEWSVDSYGRLGLSLAPGSSQPNEDDVRDFQVELQRKLTGQGM
ncbi:MAG: hypothetical protein A3K19_10155 [Lentisphaerae bacterium RIFOXYB12_FULL_65_16]|nr:MAG: hypothetical protein A3K18_27685 [Lentisphaerae bacterium RIFOXYA12_64_32]OGV91309.1 MAG: hypothetical protein A3K19_10155 [Lentisphaerae bacterium RIFOXYB12_FULL_65_16]